MSPAENSSPPARPLATATPRKRRPTAIVAPASTTVAQIHTTTATVEPLCPSPPLPLASEIANATRPSTARTTPIRWREPSVPPVKRIERNASSPMPPAAML